MYLYQDYSKFQNAELSIMYALFRIGVIIIREVNVGLNLISVCLLQSSIVVTLRLNQIIHRDYSVDSK